MSKPVSESLFHSNKRELLFFSLRNLARSPLLLHPLSCRIDTCLSLPSRRQYLFATGPIIPGTNSSTLDSLSFLNGLLLFPLRDLPADPLDMHECLRYWQIVDLSFKLFIIDVGELILRV